MVSAMLSQGLNEIEIAKALNVGQSTISRDLKFIKKESAKKLESIIVDVLPYEYDKSLLGMDSIIKRCWIIINDSTNQWTNKNKLEALKLLKESIVTKFEILNQGPVNLRARQLEDQMKDLLEENEIPQRSFMTLKGLRMQEELQRLRKGQKELKDLR